MKSLARLVFFFSLMGVAVVVQAQVVGRIWDDGTTGTLASDAHNWNGDQPIASGDLITLPSGFAVVWDLAGITPSTLTTSADLRLQQPLVVTGPLTIAGGSLDSNGQPLTVGGALTLSGGMLKAGSATVNVSGDWTFAGGDAELAGSTVSFTGSGSKTVTSAGKHFGNVVMNAPDTTLSLADQLITDGALTVAGGTLAVEAKTLQVNGGLTLSGGTLSLASGGKLTLTGSIDHALNISNGTLVAAAGSTVEYKPVGSAMTVSSGTYADLMLTGSSLFTLANDTVVTGTLTVGNGATVSFSGHTLAVPNGMIVNQGTLLADGFVRSAARSLRVTDGSFADITKISSSSGTIYVRFEDRNANKKGTTMETAPGIVVTTLSGDKETFSATESDSASGMFQTNAIVVHQGAVAQQNGQIEANQSDIIFVTYTDPADTRDVRTAEVVVALSGSIAAGTPQIVAGPRVTDFSSQTSGAGTTYTAHFVWNTDRESTSAVSITASTLTSPLTGGSLTGVTAHDVTVAGLTRGVTYSYTVSSLTADGKSVVSAAKPFVVLVEGDRIKTASSSAVYWYLNNKRNVFADFTAYDSWFKDFNGIVTVSVGQMGDTPLGKVIPVRGGTYLVKIQSDPKVYAVEPFGVLRWVATERIALALYGAQWSKRVRDIDVSLFASYTLGTTLEEGKAPESYFYRVANGEWNAFAGNVAHALDDIARAANGIDVRFVSEVAPSATAGFNTGARYFGYAPDVSGVLKDGTTSVTAPAWTPGN